MNTSTEAPTLTPQPSRLVVIYCDGRGRRPDGSGSGYGWIRPATGERHVEFVDNLTNNQSEYCAVLSAVQAVEVDAPVELRSDSELIINRLKRLCHVNDPALANLREGIFSAVREKRLLVFYRWIPRSQNLAHGLLKGR